MRVGESGGRREIGRGERGRGREAGGVMARENRAALELHGTARHAYLSI